MKFTINYFRTTSGKVPVEEYIDDIENKKERADILSVLKGIQNHGTDAVGVEFRHIEGKLWELKVKTHGNQHRIFYVALKGGNMVLLHAYLKKTPKAPINEKETAKQRLRQLMEELR